MFPQLLACWAEVLAVVSEAHLVAVSVDDGFLVGLLKLAVESNVVKLGRLCRGDSEIALGCTTVHTGVAPIEGSAPRQGAGENTSFHSGSRPQGRHGLLVEGEVAKVLSLACCEALAGSLRRTGLRDGVSE